MPAAGANAYPQIRRALQQACQAQGHTVVDLLPRYLHERFLWRLQHSDHSDNWVLKGASLLPLWLGPAARCTANLDLQKEDDRLAIDQASLRQQLADACLAGDASGRHDALQFLPDSLELQPQRSASGYVYTLVLLAVRFGRSLQRLRLCVAPKIAPSLGGQPVDLPPLLPLAAAPAPARRLRGLPLETLMAEKLHILSVASQPGAAAFGRYQDIWDLQALAAHCHISGSRLSQAIKQVFERRQTQVDSAPPWPAGDDAGSAVLAEAAWKNFLRRPPGLQAAALPEVRQALEACIGPLLAALARGHAFTLGWPPAGPWGRAQE